jgi:hypothetical protein
MAMVINRRPERFDGRSIWQSVLGGLGVRYGAITRRERHNSVTIYTLVGKR